MNDVDGLVLHNVLDPKISSILYDRIDALPWSHTIFRDVQHYGYE